MGGGLEYKREGTLKFTAESPGSSVRGSVRGFGLCENARKHETSDWSKIMTKCTCVESLNVEL